MHEFDSDLVVLENHALVDFGLRHGADAASDISDDAEVTFTTHDHVHHVGAIGHTRPRSDTSIGSGRGNVSEVQDDVFDVAVCVFLHARGASGNPTAHG